MVPRDLAGWTVDAVRVMLTAGVFEGDTFDFKERLPHGKDDGAKARLRKTCAAFANTFGGFIVFGIKDGRALPVEERLCGIDPLEELPRDFGNYPASCHPAVDWSFAPAPLSLPNGRAVHVILIPKSWKAPHGVKCGDDWSFMKRTNKGNEPMSIAEIRASFTAQAGTRQRLTTLMRQLNFNWFVMMEQQTHLQFDPPAALIASCLMRAMEDYISDPIFQQEISLGTITNLWQYTSKVQEVVRAVAAIPMSLEKRAKLVGEALALFDVIKRWTQQVIAKIDAILQRM